MVSIETPDKNSDTSIGPDCDDVRVEGMVSAFSPELGLDKKDDYIIYGRLKAGANQEAQSIPLPATPGVVKFPDHLSAHESFDTVSAE